MRYCSHTCGVEYHHVPKAACTAIKLALLRSDGLDASGIKIHTSEHWHTPPPRPPQFRFSFVRNPIDRAASCWRQKVPTGEALALGWQLPPETTFAEFVAWMVEAKPDQHFRPQVELLPAELDFVGKFESLASEWRTLGELFNLPPLEMVNGSPPAAAIETDETTRRRLVEFYQADFDAYGYDRAWPVQFRRDAWQPLQGYMSEPEARALQAAAAGRRVLEIGVWKGRSAVAMAATATQVVAIDHFRGDLFAGRANTMAEAWRNLVECGARDRVQLLAGRYVDLLPQMDLAGFGLVHYDADHTYGTTLQALRMIASRICRSCTLAVHDYDDNPNHAGVRRAVDEIAARFGFTVRQVERLALLQR